MRDTQRGRDTGRGRSRLLWDSILGPRDHGFLPVCTGVLSISVPACASWCVHTGTSTRVHACPPLSVSMDVAPRPSVGTEAHITVSTSVLSRASGRLWMLYLLSLPRTCISECFWGCAHRLVHFWGCTSTCEGVGIYLRLQAWLYQAVASPAARESSPQRQREPGPPPPSPRGAPPSPPTCWRAASPPAGTAASLDFRARVPLLGGLCLDGPSAISGTFLGFDWGLLCSCPGETALPRSPAQSRATSLGCVSPHGPAAVQGRGSGSGVGWGASLSAPGSRALDQDCGGWIIPGPPLFSCHHQMPPPPLAISSLP
ncbi:unnamed protein product [Nyctereutes procyonoides]|uniref:(raccoon dog) hypothetical protein n=1 Tax=Nyctereutes procyonoides TaxID=34880 RepID=A0A811Z2A7_NYCPR|nr:unnamed protein product [Nyctereutes procyonoides]